ncbi:MAG: alpha/beta fold hydrolase [Anaerolineae bacterium]
MVYHTDTGSGYPLILIHGLLVSGVMFKEVAPLLHAHHRLLVPDLRGHGHSHHLPGPDTIEQHAADMIALLDALGIERADVLGYSQGSTGAQQIAHHYPDRVRRLVLVCGYAFNMLTLRERVEGRLMPVLVRLLTMDQIGALMASMASDLPPEQAEQFKQMVAATDKSRALAAIRALQTFDSRPWLPTIPAPTLVIAGEHDEAVPLHHAQMLTQRIPDSTLRVIAGAGHTLAWTHPRALAACILGGEG